MKLEDIAKIAGVSRTTASYVINGKSAQYRISKTTQQKVMRVVEKYQYKPNSMASALRVGSTYSIGLIIPDIENISYARIAKYLEHLARQVGYQLIICCSDDDINTEISVANILITRKIDALIVASSMPIDNDFYIQLQRNGTPIIAIDRLLDQTHFCCVISEDHNGAFQLTKHLASKDIKRIGLISAIPELSISKQRELGFLSALKNKDINYEIIYAKQFCQIEGKKIMLEWFQKDNFPDAIMTTSYSLFEGVLDAILVEPEIANKCLFATFGDNRVLDFLPFKISSLSQQFEIICQKTLYFTLEAIKGNYQTGINLIERNIKIR